MNAGVITIKQTVPGPVDRQCGRLSHPGPAPPAPPPDGHLRPENGVAAAASGVRGIPDLPALGCWAGVGLLL